MLQKLLLSLFLFIFTISVQAQTAKDSLDYQLDRLMSESTITGMGVTIFNTDGVLYEHVAGYADIRNKIPYSTAHIQNIGSISKTYIAAALMKAVEAGMISLDDPINKYLGFKVINPNTPNRPITIRHLATHTSGILDNKFYSKAYYLTEDISDWSKEDKRNRTKENSKTSKNVLGEIP